MQTPAEVQSRVIQQAEADPQFREHLFADPKGAIEAATGVSLPDDTMVLVEEAIAVAQRAMSSAEEPLSEEELNQVLGGVCNDGNIEPEDSGRCWAP